MSDLYGRDEIIRLLDIDADELDQWLHNGELAASETEDGPLITGSALRELLKQQNRKIPSELQQAPTRIMIVDDDDMVRNSVAAILRKKMGSHVELQTASDGFEAGQMVAVFKPHLVILDIMLPGIDGYKACQMLKESYPKLKVLGITGYGARESRERMDEAGVDDMLTKPFEFAELLTSVRQLLKGTTAHD